MEPKTVVITGSTRGIGFGMATAFLKLGHNVVINGTRQKTVNKALGKFKKHKHQLLGIPGNVSKKSTHEQLFDIAHEHFGKVDIYINNAGVNSPNKLSKNLEKDEIKLVFDTNIRGTTLGTLIALRKMEEQGFGQIFNMEGFGSNGRMMPKRTIYGTSKCAVRYFTRSMAKENINSPIQIGTLSPGMVVTDFMLKSLDESNREEYNHTKNIYNILGDKVETVAPFLVKKILQSNKTNDHIIWLTSYKIMWRFFTSKFKKNDFFAF